MKRGLLAPLLGGVATLGYAPYGHWYLALGALGALFVLAARATPRQAFALGWLYGLANFLTGIYWVYISTHVYGGAPAWLGALLAVVLCAYLALYPALVLAGATSLGLWQGRTGWIGVPAAWLLLELVRGWFYSGFPWLSLGETLVDTPVARLAPLVGVHGLSGVAAFAAYALYRLAAGPGFRARAIATLALVSPVPTLLLPAPGAWTEAAGTPIRTGLIQGDIRQDEKWLPHMRYEALIRHSRLTDEAWPAQLVVWPEVALTQPWHQIKDGYLADLDAEARRHDATLLLGLLVVEGDAAPRNSVFAIGATQARYDKRHLVPFGEYFPIPRFLRPMMDVLDLPYSDFDFGAPDQPLMPAAGSRVDVSICFEDVFGAEIAQRAREASLLVNVTNDAWFGDSAAPHQHLVFSRLRAMETGRWVLRAANTGITALISPDGAVVSRLPQFRQGVLRGEVEPRRGLTPYQRWLDAPLWAASLLVLAALVLRRAKPAA